MKNETTTTPRFNYTQGAWEGEKYRQNESLYGASLSKAIRLELKEKLPNCKFSVTKQTYSGGQSISVYLIEADFNPFNELTEEITEKIRENCQRMFGQFWEDRLEQSIENYKKTTTEKLYHSLNRFYLDDDFTLSPKGLDVMKKALSIVQSYNFDDSDGQIDYFHTNFYLDIAIGKWDKPFKQTNK